jgi:hypothetical protein
MKKCKKCLETKPLTDFFNDKGFKSGKMAICKTCKQAKTYAWRKENPQKYNALAIKWRDKNPDKQHATEIKRAYGISIEEYNQLLIKQECKCAICDKQHDPSAKRGRLYVDHNHKGPKARSGVKTEIRGLLCNACNSAIGYFKDDVELLQKAIDYLKKTKT